MSQIKPLKLRCVYRRVLRVSLLLENLTQKKLFSILGRMCRRQVSIVSIVKFYL